MQIQAVLMILFVCLVVGWGIRIMKNQRLNQENQYLTAYNQLMQDQYENLSLQVKAVRKYRHDIAKHIQTLEYLQSSDERMEECLENWKEQYQALKEFQFCNDSVINALLESKQKLCQQKGIVCRLHAGTIRLPANVEAVDLAGILHNIFDNAIEALEREKSITEKHIEFTMEKEEGMLYLCISNPIPAGKKVTFLTSKSNKEDHGVGMQIIRDLVNKYHGTLTTNISNDTLMVEIRLPYENERSKEKHDEKVEQSNVSA